MGVAWTRLGTVTVTAGSVNVQGVDTRWQTAASIGDAFHGPDGKQYEVAAITSDTALQLRTPYQGATAAGQAYAIMRIVPQGSDAETMALLRQALNLTDTQLSAFMEWADSQGVVSISDGETKLPGLHGLRKLMADIAAAWAPGRQGAGTGMDADMVDGLHASQLAKAQFVGSRDMNEYAEPGLYEYDPAAQNSPTGAANYRVLALGREHRVTQMAFPYDEDRVFFRRRLDSTWGPWRELLHTGTQRPTFQGSASIAVTDSAPSLLFAGAATGRRVQLYDLSLAPAVHMGSGVDMGGGPNEHSIFYPAISGGSLKIGTYDGVTFVEQLRFAEGAVRAAGPIKPGQYTLATLPSAATYTGHTITVSNATGGPALCLSNGSAWINVRTNAPVN